MQTDSSASLHMTRVAVGVGVNGNGLDAHLPGGLDDAAGDLASIAIRIFVNMWMSR
jgi:hypothetical protein